MFSDEGGKNAAYVRARNIVYGISILLNSSMQPQVPDYYACALSNAVESPEREFPHGQRSHNAVIGAHR